jgi:hypothetical protein
VTAAGQRLGGIVRSRKKARTSDEREGHTNVRFGSSGQLVLMDEAPESIVPLNPCARGVTVIWIEARLWRPQVETSMGPGLVVVSGVDPEDPLEVTPAEHEHPVEALGPHRPDPSLGERVRPR